MGKQITLIILLILSVLKLSAQSDDTFYLDAAREKLATGDCDAAQDYYDAYKILADVVVPSLEKQIAECIGLRNRQKDYTEDAFGMDMKMIWVEGGEFMMGCTNEQGNDCYNGEKNVRKVTVDGFYIGMLEVTQAQWEKIMGTTVDQQRSKAEKSSLYGVGADYPIYYVSWDEANEFCHTLSNKTGKTYTLPTEAQWEYAARGGKNNDGTKYSGSNMLDAVGWYAGNSSSKTHTCGTKQANSLGIYDMSGNVWEWCKDWYADSYVTYVTNNPTGPSSGSRRVIRGGSWGNDAQYCGVAYHNCDAPGDRYHKVGFRVVCIPDNLPIQKEKQQDIEKRDELLTQGYVDLGLPSGTLWKNSNEEKNLTSNDALKKYGSSLPSKAQWEELIQYCTWKWVDPGEWDNAGDEEHPMWCHFGEHPYYIVKGKNGKSITITANGYIDEGANMCVGCGGIGGMGGYYMTSTTNGDNDFFYFGFDEEGQSLGQWQMQGSFLLDMRLVYND